MTYRDGWQGPKELLEIIMFMFYKTRVIVRNCCTRKKSINIAWNYKYSYYVHAALQILVWQVGWDPSMYRHVLHSTILLAMISICFTEQAVDEEGSNSVTNVPAHTLWYPSEIWRTNRRGASTCLPQSFLMLSTFLERLKTCWEPFWSMELLLLAHVLAGEDWDSDQVMLQASQLPSGNRRIREQQKNSTGLHSALVQVGITAIFRAKSS